MNKKYYLPFMAVASAALLASCGGDDSSDSRPNSFQFSDESTAEPGEMSTAPGIFITGLDSSTRVTISGGEYAIGDGEFTSEAGRIDNQSRIRVRTQASGDFEGVREVTLTIGGVSDTYTVQTRPADISVDDIDFGEFNAALVDSEVTSNTVTISGIEIPVEASGPDTLLYSVNGSAYTNTLGTLQDGDTLSLQMMAPETYSETNDFTINIGPESFTFSVTTEALNTRRIEAEEATLLGNAAVFNNKVNVPEADGSGVEFASPIPAESISMTYWSETEGTISVTVDGEDYSSFIFNDTQTEDEMGYTGDAKVVSINKPIPLNANVRVIFNDDDTPIEIDYLEVHPQRIASITTLGRIGRNADGMRRTPSGNFVIGGSYPILEVTPEGDISELPASSQTQGGPLGLDFDSAGNLYVANWGQNNVEMFAPGQTGQLANTPDSINGPNSLAVVNDNHFVTANCGATSPGTSITRYQADGTEISVVEIEPGLDSSCIAGVTYDNEENLYASNWVTGRIFRVTPDDSVELVAQIEGAQVNHLRYHNGYIYAPGTTDGRFHIIDITQSPAVVESFGSTEQNLIIDGDIRTANFILSNSVDIGADGETVYFTDDSRLNAYFRRLEYVENVPQANEFVAEPGVPVNVTMNVTVPSNTPVDANVYVTGSFQANTWTPREEDYRLTRQENGTYSITLELEDSTYQQFKFTLGPWGFEETLADGNTSPNHTLIVDEEVTIQNYVVEGWQAIPGE